MTQPAWTLTDKEKNKANKTKGIITDGKIRRVSQKNNTIIFYKKFVKDNNLMLKDKIIYAEHGDFSSGLFNFKLFRIFFQGKVNNFTSILR